MTIVAAALPDSVKALIGSQVAGKGYGNVSECVRDVPREVPA